MTGGLAGTTPTTSHVIHDPNRMCVRTSAPNHTRCPYDTGHQTYHVPLVTAPSHLTLWLHHVHRRLPALAPLLTQPPELQAYFIYLLLRWLGALLSTHHRWSPSSRPTPPPTRG